MPDIPTSQPSRARIILVQIVRWTLAAFLVLLAPCFFLAGIFLLVGWTAEPQPPAAGTVKLLMTLGFFIFCFGTLQFGCRWICDMVFPSPQNQFTNFMMPNTALEPTATAP